MVRVLANHAHKPEFIPVPLKTRYGGFMPVIVALGREKQEVRKFEAILSYRTSLRPAWVM